MAITNLNQELWSNILLQGTLKELSYQEVVNNIGEVSGKTVHFSNIGDINISTYTKNTDISNQTLTDSGIDLDLDQYRYFAVNVDNIDQAETNVNILSEVARKAVHGLKNSADSYIAGLHGDAGITTGLGDDTTPIEINSANILEYLRKIARLLDEANADVRSRWVVLPSFMKEDLAKALPALDTNNSEMLATGYIGMFAGLHIYHSNNVVNTAGEAYKVMAGDGDAIRFGHTVDKVESLVNPSQFGQILRGLYCYGAVVSRASTLACLTANEAAEA